MIVDLHTHLLPGMDDGSSTPEESLAMLHAMGAQGIGAVVATPHFDPWHEAVSDFLQRRADALLALERAAGDIPLPVVLPGAEVRFRPELCQGMELDRLCLGSGGCLLLELPFEPWSARTLNKVYELVSASGVTPVLAHVERYAPIQGRERMDELYSMGAPMQMSAAYVLGRRTRHRALSMLEQGRVHLLASDAHNMADRPPDLAPALAAVRTRLGAGLADRLERRAMEAAGLPWEVRL